MDHIENTARRLSVYVCLMDDNPWYRLRPMLVVICESEVLRSTEEEMFKAQII